MSRFLNNLNFKLKTVIILNILVVTLSSLSFASNWDKTDKILFGIFTATTAIDYLQTNYVHSPRRKVTKYRDAYNERNPIVKSGVKEFGTGFIPVYFGGCILSGWYISDKLKSRNRKILLSALVLLETIVIVDNKNKGVGLNFKF